MITQPPLPNHTYHYIAAAYTLAYLPHSYSLYKMMTTKTPKYTFTNLTPRSNLSSLATHLPPSEYNTLLRCRGAHLNALESFPLFAAAMLAGKIAGVSDRELNTLGAEYLAVRVLYNALYVGVRSERGSYARSAVFAWSVGIPVWLLWRAGRMGGGL